MLSVHGCQIRNSISPGSALPDMPYVLPHIADCAARLVGTPFWSGEYLNLLHSYMSFRNCKSCSETNHPLFYLIAFSGLHHSVKSFWWVHHPPPPPSR